MRVIEILFFFIVGVPIGMVLLAGVILFYNDNGKKRVAYKDDTYDINFLRR